MKRINYFDGCEFVYLKEINLLSNNGMYTRDFQKISNKWKEFLDINELFCLPANPIKLIVAPYQKLVKYFFYFEEYIKKTFPLHTFTDKKSKTYIELKKNKDKFIKNILSIFNYDIYVKKEDIVKGNIASYSNLIASFFRNHSGSNEFNIYSCYYCESTFIGTYNDKSDRTFDIDHFFPKEQYPIFALSLYNFVPSCQICNSRIKGSSNFLHFYNLNNKDPVLFKMSPSSPKYDFYKNVKIRIEPDSIGKTKDCLTYGEDFFKHSELYKISFDCDKDYQKIVNGFKLQERYNMTSIKNKALFLEDLKIRYPISKLIYICNLLNETGISISLDEIYNSIFHDNQYVELLEKMKFDILH